MLVYLHKKTWQAASSEPDAAAVSELMGRVAEMEKTLAEVQTATREPG